MSTGHLTQMLQYVGTLPNSTRVYDVVKKGIAKFDTHQELADYMFPLDDIMTYRSFDFTKPQIRQAVAMVIECLTTQHPNVRAFCDWLSSFYDWDNQMFKQIGVNRYIKNANPHYRIVVGGSTYW